MNLLGDDPKTTVIGAGMGALNYAGTVGLDVPHNQEGWINFGVSVLMFILGRFINEVR